MRPLVGHPALCLHVLLEQMLARRLRREALNVCTISTNITDVPSAPSLRAEHATVQDTLVALLTYGCSWVLRKQVSWQVQGGI